MLLLHLSGELGEADRLTMESRLASDAGLRGRFEALMSVDGMMRAEAAVRPVSAVDSRQALSRSLHLVREQALILPSRPSMRTGGRGLRGIPRWAWGSAVAACVAVGLVVWISNSDPAPLKVARDYSSNVDDDGIPRQRGEFMAMSAAFGMIEPAGSEGPAADIEAHIEALNQLAVMNEIN